MPRSASVEVGASVRVVNQIRSDEELAQALAERDKMDMIQEGDDESRNNGSATRPSGGNAGGPPFRSEESETESEHLRFRLEESGTGSEDAEDESDVDFVPSGEEEGNGPNSGSLFNGPGDTGDDSVDSEGLQDSDSGDVQNGSGSGRPVVDDPNSSESASNDGETASNDDGSVESNVVGIPNDFAGWSCHGFKDANGARFISPNEGIAGPNGAAVKVAKRLDSGGSVRDATMGSLFMTSSLAGDTLKVKKLVDAMVGQPSSDEEDSDGGDRKPKANRKCKSKGKKANRQIPKPANVPITLHDANDRIIDLELKVKEILSFSKFADRDRK